MELISDPTLYLFFERMKRGGLSYVGNRQAEANVPWDTTHYDPTKEICHLMYVGKLTIEGERSIDRSNHCILTSERKSHDPLTNLAISFFFSFIREQSVRFRDVRTAPIQRRSILHASRNSGFGSRVYAKRRETSRFGGGRRICFRVRSQLSHRSRRIFR